MIFATSLDPDQAPQNVGALSVIQTVWHSDYISNISHNIGGKQWTFAIFFKENQSRKI